MKKQTTRTESKMLEEVYRWRREAYQARQALTEEQRATRLRELADEFGLRIAEPRRSRPR